MKKRSKKYNPTSKYNPAFQARKLDSLAKKLEIHRRDIHAISKSHDNHISYLGNFARHDLKNAIQSMDSILTTTKPNEVDENTINSLSTYLDVIRNTIDNFAKLVPYSTTGRFKLDTLMIAVELLVRADMQKHEISVKFDYPRDSKVEIELPFHVILQMLNNLIINSIKALESVEPKKLFINADINSKELTIKIHDNGTRIIPEDSKRIFEYGYSTTGGSGIGLYHARYLCDEFSGLIDVDLTEHEDFNKTFSITLPITLQNGENSSDN
jgi:signal transduction histidine kinase